METNYEDLIKSVNMKYKNVLQKRKLKNTTSLHQSFYSYITWFIITPGIARLLSLLLRLPPFRVPYTFAMNSPSSPKKMRNRLGWSARKAVRIHPPLSRAFKTGKALIIYYSISGNTEKVALAIERGCRKADLQPVVKKVLDAFEEELYDYDLVCVGTPVIHGLPPHPIMKFLLEKGTEYRNRGDVFINTKKIPGKNALVFVTFSGPHIGVAEAIPAGKFIQQNLEHLGFDVKDEWYVVGEFHGWKAGSTRGRLRDIRGRPNADDLARIEEKTIKLVESLKRVP